MTINRVYIAADDTIVALHPEAQLDAPPLAAYAEAGAVEMVYLPSEVASSATERVERADGEVMYLPRKLPAGWRETYGEGSPVSITSTSGKRVLLRAGLLGKVRDMMVALPDGDEKEEAMLSFDAPRWFRADPMFGMIGAALDPPLSAATINGMFRQADQA